MKYITILIAALAASVMAQKKKAGCGFPDGPDCVSIGDGADGLEQFVDPKGTEPGCCVFPLRCGNGDGGQSCVFVGEE